MVRVPSVVVVGSPVELLYAFVTVGSDVPIVDETALDVARPAPS
jgi:hypothetical protein